MFQKCPICSGCSSGWLPPCSVCGNAGIIDEVTGLPPIQAYTTVSTLTDEEIEAIINSGGSKEQK